MSNYRICTGTWVVKTVNAFLQIIGCIFILSTKSSQITCVLNAVSSHTTFLLFSWKEKEKASRTEEGSRMTQPPDLQQVTVLSKSEWRRIQDELNQVNRDKERMRATAKQREALHLQSQEVVKLWPNTISVSCLLLVVLHSDVLVRLCVMKARCSAVRNSTKKHAKGLHALCLHL